MSGSSVTLSNIIVGSLTGPPGSANTEVALDIEMAISMAPGLSTVYVYEATNNSAEGDVMLSRMATDNLAHQISSSWTGFDDAGTEQAFVEFAAQGQSYFQASGDSGEYNFRHNPVEPPSDSPNVTSVGGTTLSTSSGAWSSETTWNWFTSPMDGLSNNATSGGTSTTLPRLPVVAIGNQHVGKPRVVELSKSPGCGDGCQSNLCDGRQRSDLLRRRHQRCRAALGGTCGIDQSATRLARATA